MNWKDDLIEKLIVKAILKRKKNKNTGRTEWCLVSRKDPSKILEWYGKEKPSEKAVSKSEKRINWFKHHK